jgi:hypothetical protein
MPAAWKSENIRLTLQPTAAEVELVATRTTPLDWTQLTRPGAKHDSKHAEYRLRTLAKQLDKDDWRDRGYNIRLFQFGSKRSARRLLSSQRSRLILSPPIDLPERRIGATVSALNSLVN